MTVINHAAERGSAHAEATWDFVQRVATRDLRVGIVGLGYAGLPLAIAFAEAGFATTGLELNPDRVAAVREGRSYLVDVPEERYAAAGGRLDATDDLDAVAELDALTICVPTPLQNQRPDLGYIKRAAEAIATKVTPGTLVILQSTTTPGTTEELLVPILEQAGLRVGVDVFVGYAPERVDPGNSRYGLRNTPKVVAGVTDACRERTRALYATIVDEVVPVSSPTVAETVKLHENTFRQVNIALANELALMCDRLGISAWEVIDAAKTKPFAFMAHYPGPGVGGDCIPVVPHFLTWRLREKGYATRLIDAAHAVNRDMPLHVAGKVVDALNEVGRPVKGSRIVVMGVTYKPDVHDTRESPALEVIRELDRRGGAVRFCDPYVDRVLVGDRLHERLPWSFETIAEADCVVMLVPHRAFLERPYWREAELLVDAGNHVAGDVPGVWRL
ncbi:MAG TPA: nucleotide sugar dehydrogenase [Solirubrobacteraceae bacterium]|jgi:UDP-N-acetyl-D-glucosamine dehydrogenase